MQHNYAAIRFAGPCMNKYNFFFFLGGGGAHTVLTNLAEKYLIFRKYVFMYTLDPIATIIIDTLGPNLYTKFCGDMLLMQHLHFAECRLHW